MFGPRSNASDEGAVGDATTWISMLGHRSDPVPMVLAHLRLLRLLPHRGGLLRPYFADAWRARRAARERFS
jgi:hypothetical protein